MSSSPEYRRQESSEEVVMDKEATGAGLQHTMTSGTTVMMSEAMFEKLYLTPKTERGSDNTKRFANPTPIGLVGFVISTFTFSMVLMGWGGANGLYGVAGIFFFTGPVLLILALIFEWIMGNFFPMMVMGLFAVFWLSFGMLQLPTLGLAAAYSTTGDNMAEGMASPAYNAVIALYLLVWGFALLTFFIFTLRTNAVFASIFLFVTIGVFILSGAYWKVSTGDFSQAQTLQKAGAALLFVVAILGWYMTFVIMSYEMKMGLKLPLGDLSHFWPKEKDLEAKQE
ncbi:alcS-like protein [Elsinoe australis]|uniref:AlcS-like protein n=1 Tax=Elsinoe australis TaxID=40998 RepID=A0A4U7B459_9PEZI|nr:alcS-like protein [Elsinoe australis]